MLTQLVDALSQGTVDVGVGLVLLLAAQAMFAGSFTVGDFALFAAYTPQAPRLFSDELRHNILLGLPEAEVDLQGALETAVFLPDLAEMEHGLETTVGPRDVHLSGSQIQRAAARTFVRERPPNDESSGYEVKASRRLSFGRR